MSLVAPFYPAQQGLHFYPIFLIQRFLLLGAISLSFQFSCSFRHLLVSPTFGGISQLRYQHIFARILFPSPAESTHTSSSGSRFCRKPARVPGSVQYQATDTSTRLHLGCSFHFQFSVPVLTRFRFSIFENTKNTKNILLFICFDIKLCLVGL